MKFWQLQACDVLVRNGHPIFVVLECSPDKNVFRWLSLLNDNFGAVGSPDFDRTEMWNERVFDTYDEVFRGSTVLT